MRLKFYGLILPGFILSFLAGVVVGFVIFFFKLAIDYILKLNNLIYHFLNNYIYFIPVTIIILLMVSIMQGKIVKKIPIVKGGGIPTSEGIVRGSINFNPLLSGIFTAIFSFLSYIIGMPLGSEGPSVAIGTSLSRMVSKICPSYDEAYKGYIMTSGAAAAFAVATGTIISGVIFALEEIHRRFSPMIILVSFQAVIAGSIVAKLLSNFFGVSYKMFNLISYNDLEIYHYLIFIPFSIIIGILAWSFNHLVKYVERLLDTKMKKVKTWQKIFVAYLCVIIVGLFLPTILNGGHALIDGLFENKYSIIIILLTFILKIIMLVYISQSGVTGGMYIPILTIGALAGALFVKIFKLDDSLVLFICLGMSAFMGTAIGCPLSALVFACEALSGIDHILPFAIVIIVSYFIGRLLNISHLYDIVLERKLHNDYAKKDFMVIQTSVIVSEKSFAVGKQTRDLLFNANVILTQIRRSDKDYAKMDNFGDKIIKPGDEITFIIQTYNICDTKTHLEAFVGKQKDFSYDILQQ